MHKRGFLQFRLTWLKYLESAVVALRDVAKEIDAAVKAADIRKVAESLRDHERSSREYLIPKYGDLLSR